ncbi:hypothetical protein OG948_34570 (plasmid) [Embleya sp. NBC_00888]|nr:hypothetical protein OG948_34570 [Embleya sp. NBC_00888]
MTTLARRPGKHPSKGRREGLVDKASRAVDDRVDRALTNEK